MEFKSGEVVNITEGRFPKPYSLSLIDRRKGLVVSNLRKSYVKGGVLAHGVVYGGKIYGSFAIEMLAEQTPIKVVNGEKRVTLRGDLSLLNKMAPISLDYRTLADNEPIRFGLPPKPAKH